MTAYELFRPFSDRLPRTARSSDKQVDLNFDHHEMDDIWMTSGVSDSPSRCVSALGTGFVAQGYKTSHNAGHAAADGRTSHSGERQIRNYQAEQPEASAWRLILSAAGR